MASSRKNCFDCLLTLDKVLQNIKTKMKKKFSKKWAGSKQPRKKRKYAANAPIHIKRKLLSVNLSKDLREKHGKRNIVIRKGDKVKVLRGKNKGKTGKITRVEIKRTKVYIENIQKTKIEGSKVEIPFRPSNLQIIELYEEDNKRLKKKTETPKKSEKKEKNNKEKLNKDKNKKIQEKSKENKK
jgi:large subunit ribosomal protein L24